MIKILSWNIHRCFGRDKQFSPKRILNVIKAVDPDVIALQEIESVDEGGLDLLSHFAELLDMEKISGPTMFQDGTPYGNACLIRGSVEHTSFLDFTYKNREPRGAIVTDVIVNGTPFTFAATHLGLRYFERKMQLDKLLESVLLRNADKLVLAGDFNEWRPKTRQFNQLKKNLSVHADSQGPTFPSGMPMFKLDRIFMSNNFASTQTHVVTTNEAAMASDHLPIVSLVSE